MTARMPFPKMVFKYMNLFENVLPCSGDTHCCPQQELSVDIGTKV